MRANFDKFRSISPFFDKNQQNIAKLSTNFRKRFCLDTFEFQNCMRMFQRKFGRQFKKICEISKEMFRNFEECFNFLNRFSNFQRVQQIFEAKLSTVYSERRLSLRFNQGAEKKRILFCALVSINRLRK